MIRLVRDSLLGLLCSVIGFAAVGQTSVDPKGRSVLFIRGADGSGGLGNGTAQQRTEHLSDIGNQSTSPGNHGFGELASLLRADGFAVTQWIESQGTMNGGLLMPHRIVVFGSNNRTYSAAEIAAFHAFMDGGGSALFMSDANWGANFNAAPMSDNQFLARYGLSVYQDSANGVPVLSRATPGRFVQPSFPALSGPDGSGGVDDIADYDGEGVSYFHVDRASGGWVAAILVNATGFQVRSLTTNNQPGSTAFAGPRDAAMVMAQKDDGLILGHFDRNTFFNRNGTGTDLTRRDNRQLALNLFRTLASVQGRTTAVGSACGGSGRTPQLIAGTPDLGQSIFWSVNGAAPNQLTGLLLAPGRAQPVALSGPCFAQPDLANSSYFLLGPTDATGRLVRQFLLPRTHTLSGCLFTAQMVIAATGGPVYGVAELTGGVELRFGFAR